jgi:UDP-glucuronate decarboxylase
MKKVLITGANGFIGRSCLPLLQKRGYEIYALSSKKPSSLENGIQWIQCNLLYSDTVNQLMSSLKPTHLLHLAWITVPGALWKSLDNLTWLKVSLDLIKSFALNEGKRAVIAGTCAEYDWGANEFIEGKTPCLPRTIYGSSKLALHLLLESLAKEIGFSQAWGRLFYLYGPHEHPQRFVPSVINGLLKKQPVPCSHGNQIRDFLHVQDVADAFVTLLDKEVQGVVNIGSGVGISLRQMIEKIIAKLGDKELIQFDALTVPSDDPVSLVANVKRLNEELNWRPKYGLEEGLKETISWWKNEL